MIGGNGHSWTRPHRFFSKRRRGSTMVEVLMAIAVLAVGASGVMAMQKATLMANRNAKNLEIANSIASSWVQRLRADAMLWNHPVSAADPLQDINTDTRWLKNHVQAPGSANWFRPVDQPLGIYGVHDAFGHDDPSGNLNGPFCVNLRLSWIEPGKLVRAEVRVYWLRDGIQPESGNLSTQIPNPLCGASSTPVPAIDNASDVFHIVQVVTSISQNPVPTK